MKPASRPIPAFSRSARAASGACPEPTRLARAVQGAIAVLALGAGAVPVWAQDADAGESIRLKPGALLQETLPPETRKQLPTFVWGERMEGKTDDLTVIEGEVELRRHDTVIRADRVEFDQRTNEALATGHVLINRSGDRFEGPELQMNVETYKGHFSEPTYRLLKNQANGDASRIDFLSRDKMVVHDGRYSTCERPPGSTWMPDWLVRATTIDLDTEEDVGTAKGGVLEFKGVPILAAPYFTFPLSDKRKSGVLPPSMAIDNQSGVQLTAPYYLNLAPNMDATLVPSLMTKRGVDLAGEFRYLQPSYTGRLRAAFMPSDRLRDDDRWAYSLQHNQRLTDNVGGGGPIGLRVNLNRVGDDNYWRDFPRSITSLTSRLLPSEVVAGWSSGPWSIGGGAYRWQALQDTSAPFTPPFDRLPSVGLSYQKTDQTLLGSSDWDVAVRTNFTRFQRSVLSTAGELKSGGDRSLAVAELTRRWQSPGWFVQPRARLHATQYQFDNTAGVPTSASRAVPTVSVDSGLVFERPAAYFGRQYTQTLEPRAFFTWTPYRDQTGLPNFDSGARDFNLATMFAENAYNGHDRISDTRAVTLGVNSRLLDVDNGAEVIRLGIAQRLLLEDQNVTLPGGTPVTERLSDMLLAARVQWDPLWSFDTTLQYNPKSRESVRTTVGGRYTPGPFRVLSAAYRIQRGTSEQIDLGWQWPLAALWGNAPARVPGRALGPGQWYSVGRLNYSMPDRKIIDLVAGFEYDAGCWLGRVVVSRLQQSTTAANQSILFQLEFSGFSRVGASSLQTLQGNVPKYQYLREEIAPPSRFQQYD
ncbi:MAG: LPS-assembly protein LptD [Hydrogenophaga sp.]|uniref:LPS-assembly protein LptD n=1 Tax=Hydrogenophaga sp. TaxID=1904254 RepID=UPI00272FE97E|nr:LPS-assembly protein LptD [Hydrogenophaga sp.]MDP2405352.1 LPS-assembly protein LptD [Hydrogenophaga sp.]MDZ4176921.1 LPS-assembly protein LptD [Hydrogenophaga sp.]